MDCAYTEDWIVKGMFWRVTVIRDKRNAKAKGLAGMAESLAGMPEQK